jgi:hypothetical protein
MAEELAEKRMFIKIVQKITNAMAVIERISILLRYRSLCGYMITILLSVRPDSRLNVPGHRHGFLLLESDDRSINLSFVFRLRFSIEHPAVSNSRPGTPCPSPSTTHPMRAAARVRTAPWTAAAEAIPEMFRKPVRSPRQPRAF